jgi:hypothetical protein
MSLSYVEILGYNILFYFLCKYFSKYLASDIGFIGDENRGTYRNENFPLYS